MTKNPLVSAVIPAYNAERYVAEAIDSILAQTYRLIVEKADWRENYLCRSPTLAL